MVVISYSGKEANAKIVYYGPGLGGKTTNLEFIYDSVPASSRGKMVSMKTQTDRTLFFDFLPLDLGELGGFRTRFLLYTVPGQVFYNATRKLVLRGCDAIAFIADSQVGKMEENKESLSNLVENLAEYDLKLDDIPWVIQYNKRDLPEVYTIEELNRELNPKNVPYFEAVAMEGTGVFETFRGLSRLLLEKLSEEIGHRMVIGKTFGRGQEREKEAEISGAKPTAQVETVRQPEKVEPETVESSSAAELETLRQPEEVEPEATEPSSAVSPEASEVDLEELEILAPIEDSTISYSETAQETAVQETHRMDSEAELEPTIAQEQEILHGFFGEAIKSAPLEKEIVREEVILSKEPDQEGVSEPASQASTYEQETEKEGHADEWPGKPLHEKLDEHVSVGDEHTEPSGDEPFFRQMIRRNNIGVFGGHKEETEGHAGGTDSAELAYPQDVGLDQLIPTQAVPHDIEIEPVAQEEPDHGVLDRELARTGVKSLEQVIEIPASMLRGDGEKEIVITLRLRLKASVENSEAKADEFLLDGISR